MPIKTNLTGDATGMAFTIRPAVLDGIGELPRIAWEQTPIPSVDVEQLLGGDTADRAAPARDTARAFLLSALADGPCPAKDLLAVASEDGIPERTLRRAKRELHITARKQASGPWEWALPEVAP